MNVDMISTKELQYFVGKVCTILTKQVTGTFKIEDRRFVDFFTGRVIAINQTTVWLEHVITKAKSAFFIDALAAIVEEQTVAEDHPDIKELKANYAHRQEAAQAPKQPYVSVSSLKQTANSLKEKYKLEDDLR